jgi:hypothetical protein
MLRTLALTAPLFLALACAPAATMGTRTHYGFSVGITSAPPPPRLVYVEEPAVLLVPGTNVYVVESAGVDVFRYGGSWYAQRDGYWYRASRYDGPYAVVDVRRVPTQVLTVPAKHWKRHPHGGPPGLMKKTRDR